MMEKKKKPPTLPSNEKQSECVATTHNVPSKFFICWHFIFEYLSLKQISSLAPLSLVPCSLFHFLSLPVDAIYQTNIKTGEN